MTPPTRRSALRSAATSALWSQTRQHLVDKGLRGTEILLGCEEPFDVVLVEVRRDGRVFGKDGGESVSFRYCAVAGGFDSLMCVGFAAVLLLDRLARSTEPDTSQPS